MLFAWAIDSGPVQVWGVTTNAKIPLEIRFALQNPDVLVYAHNSHFDRTVLNHAMPGVAAGGVEQWRDTMVRALAHGLPGSLGDLGDLGDILSVSQDKAGKQLIQLFCKPRPKTPRYCQNTSCRVAAIRMCELVYGGLPPPSVLKRSKNRHYWAFRGSVLHCVALKFLIPCLIVSQART